MGEPPWEPQHDDAADEAMRALLAEPCAVRDPVVYAHLSAWRLGCESAKSLLPKLVMALWKQKCEAHEQLLKVLQASPAPITLPADEPAVVEAAK